MPLTVLVTGANRGLGLEFAREYHRRGDRVIATARNPKDAPDLFHLAAEVLPLDVGNAASVEGLGSMLQGKPIDILINNAGIMGHEASIARASHDEMLRVFAVNSVAPMVVLKTLVANLKLGQRKLVVNVSSTLGSLSKATGGFSYSYCASKAALNMMTILAARELERDGIIVSTFCPGWNRTAMGGSGAPLDPAQSVKSLIGVADRLKLADSGKFLSHEGESIPW